MKEDDKSQLKEVLRSVDCETYYSLFEDNDVNIELLSLMDKPSLKELGVSKVGDRLRIQILIALLNLEKVRSQVPVHDLVNAVKMSYTGLVGIEEIVGKAEERSEEGEEHERIRERAVTGREGKHMSNANIIMVITQDGREHRIDISGCYTSLAIKRTILSQIQTSGPIMADEWSTYYIDKASSVHLMFNIELATVCNSPHLEEKNRIIFCRTGEAPSDSAINTSNRILNRGNNGSDTSRESMMLRNLMGQRPPSQLISTNLGEYFPDIGPVELKKVMRNSYRLSVLQGRQSMASGPSSMWRESMVSGVSMMSSGVGHPMRINQTVGDVLLSSRLIQESRKDDDEEATNKVLEDSQVATVSGSSDLGTAAGASALTVTSPTSVEIADKRCSSFIELLDDDDDEGEDLVDIYGGIGVNSLVSGGSGSGGVMKSEIRNRPSVWHKGTKIGQGSYGSVYLGLDGLTGELMAVKEVDLPTSSEDSRNKMVTALKREMNLLRELNHENIVRYLGSAADSAKMYIFLEYIPGGSVSSMLHTYGPFEEPLVRNFLAQVLIGVRYLHRNGIIHRDIKGANILIDINGTVKIGDFGISKRTASSSGEDADHTDIMDEKEVKKSRRASFQGSVYWMAPEVVKQIASTEKSDIWSVGCLAVEMFTAQHPYPGFSQMQAIFRIGTLTLPEYPANCSEIGREFLDLTFETDYKKRVGAASLLKHAFLKPLFRVTESIPEGV
ncbi:DEKNAAC101438 [Brettanomyces naardenensis]|uniref:mitogen-activated protein kinase kinase kinase n=1 Tax=Brettanomyces naardenensis TaxID=13370 RepID=A0A448YI54_BRENA|nr:DEKNAAC101438 [Brettanomyces naardenensis]